MQLGYPQFFTRTDCDIFQLEYLGAGLAIGLDVMNGVVHHQFLTSAAR